MNPKHHKTTCRSILALAVLACAGLLSASPARAGGEFRNAFEVQLGQLAAYEVVSLGRHLLYGPQLVHYAVPVPRYAAPLYLEHRHHARHHAPRHHDAPCMTKSGHRGKWRGHDRGRHGARRPSVRHDRD
ncbi:MAG: hypothetical protein OEM49_14260 [Myxococcales bacterium]|nr:hypothetical protein [Myxococcales bacterium]